VRDRITNGYSSVEPAASWAKGGSFPANVRQVPNDSLRASAATCSLLAAAAEAPAWRLRPYNDAGKMGVIHFQLRLGTRHRRIPRRGQSGVAESTASRTVLFFRAQDWPKNNFSANPRPLRALPIKLRFQVTLWANDKFAHKVGRTDFSGISVLTLRLGEQ
jgi:hypothetical protein